MYLTIMIVFLTILPIGDFMFNLQPIISEIEIKGFNSIYYFEFEKNFTHTPEKHDFWEMVYVDDGKVLAITDGNSCTLNQGEIIFHEPGEIHAHISDMEVKNNMLVVSFTTNSNAMEFFRKKTFSADKTAKTLLSLFLSEARNALQSIPYEYTDKRDLDFSHAEFGSSQLLSCYFTEFLIQLIRSNTNFNNRIVATEKSRAIAQSSICELIFDYMKENIYENLTLSDICKHFMIGKSQLSHIFKTNIGKSVMEYYNDLKIAEAKKLIRNDRYSISQISDMLGYSCIHCFSRSFKRSTGRSPTDYKKRIAQ